MYSTLLGIVFAGNVNCKSDNANPATPGQTGANPVQIKLAQSAGQLRPLVQLGWIILLQSRI